MIDESRQFSKQQKEDIQEAYKSKLRNIILIVAISLGSCLWISVFVAAFFSDKVRIFKLGVFLAGLAIIGKLLFII